MAQGGASKRNELVAGGFVLLMIAAGLGVLSLVGGGRNMTASMRSVRVAFPLNPGVRGVTVGSPVQLAGVQVGTVTAIDPAGSDAAGRPAVVVTLSVPDAVAPKSDARVFVLTNPLGGGGVIDIRGLGTGPAAGDAPIAGEPATNVLVEDAVAGLGIDRTGREQLAKAIAGVAAAAEKLNRRLDDGGDLAVALKGLRDLAGPEGDLAVTARWLRKQTETGGDAAAALADGRKLIQQLGYRLDDLVPELKKLREKADAAFATVETVVKDLQARTNPVLDSAQKAVRAAEEVIAENRGDIRRAVESGRDALADARETAAFFVKSRTRLESALDNLDKAAASARDLLASNAPEVTASVSRLKDAVAQLNSAIREIRGSPWKLLLVNYDERKLANANLLDAARAFNEGAAGVEDSVGRLSRLLESGAAKGRDEDLRKALAELRGRMDKLSDAEKTLFEKIK
jgi:ABC-type transporter Mla subunit MlaD